MRRYAFIGVLNYNGLFLAVLAVYESASNKKVRHSEYLKILIIIQYSVTGIFGVKFQFFEIFMSSDISMDDFVKTVGVIE